jgi:CRP-like cAMP-binding protein
MLRKTTRGDAVIIKLIDFGCSEVLSHSEAEGTRLPTTRRTLTHNHGATTAYCPPEAFDDVAVHLDPSVDMWALGVIVYMMLLGRHPFDSDGDASDEVIAERIKEQRQPPLSGDGSHAGNLSPSALDLIVKLMEPDPKKRMTAHEMLHHPWVTGETASEYVMEDSAQRLKQLSGYKSGIEKTVIEKLLSYSSEDSDEGTSNNDKRTSLLERAFNHLDKDRKGFLDRKDLKALSIPNKSALRRRGTTREEAEHKMSFDHFSDIIGQNMKSIHFKKGQVIYNEDDEGDYMYFINSGTIEVSTKDGFRAKKGQGDMFGKGGIMGKKRRTTITCTTPVNALRIDKDFFSKYVIKGSPLATTLREKGNKEKFERALDILERNGNMTERTYKKGDFLFKQGEVPVDAYITKEGLVDITFAEHHIYSAKPGRLFGINSQALSRNRKASAVCATDTCVIRCMSLNELQKLSNKFPVLESTLKELALRQEFRRAVVIRRMRSFPNKQQLKEAFDDIDQDRSGTLNKAELSQLMQSLGAAFSDGEM